MTAPVEEDVDPAVEALVTNEGQAHDLVSDNLVTALMAIWAGFTAFYAGEAVASLGQQIARLIIAGQRQSGRITESHLRLQVRRMGFELPGGALVELPSDLRLGAATEEVYQRPVREVRYLVSEGVPEPEAIETARERLEKQALTDLQLARATSAQQVMYRFPQATGWRRIIHPELGNVCGLCIAAADRVYQRIERLALHPACKCTILPVVGGVDPGRALNENDLALIYEAAGGTTESRALAQTRFEIKKNGELGEVLVPGQGKMRGPRQVKQQLSERAAKLRREQLERQIAEMRPRAERSQWHRDRLEQLQALLDAA